MRGFAEWGRPPRPVVFLDRDGTLNRSTVRDGIPRPPDSVEELAWLPGTLTATRRLSAAGFALVVITNQPDVARGAQRRSVVEAINRRAEDELPILGVLTCYHDDRDDCPCRKPRPGLLLEAARRWGLDLGHAFLIGDRWRDIEAGRAVGCRTVLIDTPYSGHGRCRPDHLATDLVEAAHWIVEEPAILVGGAHEAVR